MNNNSTASLRVRVTTLLIRNGQSTRTQKIFYLVDSNKIYTYDAYARNDWVYWGLLSAGSDTLFKTSKSSSKMEFLLYVGQDLHQSFYG